MTKQAQGMFFALIGFSLLTVGDSIVKSVAGAWSGAAVAATRFTIAAVVLAALMLIKEGRSGFVLARPGIQCARGAAIGLSSVCFFQSLFLMPLAEATSITFTSPLFAALFSAVLLKERVPRVALFASVFALLGVLMILRPNLAEVGWAAALPIGAAMGMAMLLTLNRVLAADGNSVLSMQFWVAAFATPILWAAALIGHASGVEALQLGVPSLLTLFKCGLVALTATMTHTLLYVATTRASAAIVAPMTYVQLLMAVALGWAIFGDVPDLTSCAGAVLIVGSGLALWRWK